MQHAPHKAATGGRAQFAEDDIGTAVALPYQEDQCPRQSSLRGQRPRLYALALVFLFAGCSWSAPPQFRLNTEGRDPRSITRAQTAAIAVTLERLFGTPDEPAVPQGIDLDINLLKTAAGPIGSDADDRAWGLYRKHCMACHGLSGDGAGPNAADLDPYPRDFRNGVFKYTSTAATAKPLRDDLARTLQNGIPGTAMPSFARLPREQSESLLEYVKYLSIRGETELYLMRLVVDQHAPLPLDRSKVLEQATVRADASWRTAADMALVPPPAPQADTFEELSVSIDRGRELFRTMGAQCFMCHGYTGKGDGTRTDLCDDWNKLKIGDCLDPPQEQYGDCPKQSGDCPNFSVRKNGTVPLSDQALASRFQLPYQPLRARDFSLGIFHGGDRPVDIYWRIAAGIKGTPMPGVIPAPGKHGSLSPEDIWHVVNYVRSLHRPNAEP